MESSKKMALLGTNHGVWVNIEKAYQQSGAITKNFGVVFTLRIKCTHTYMFVVEII